MNRAQQKAIFAKMGGGGSRSAGGGSMMDQARANTSALQKNTNQLKKNYRDLKKNPLQRMAEKNTKALKKNAAELSLQASLGKNTAELQDTYNQLRENAEIAKNYPNAKLLSRESNKLGNERESPAARARRQEVERKQIQLNRALINNTRYKIGKQNAQGYYETYPGQYAQAVAYGAIPSSTGMREEYRRALATNRGGTPPA